MDISKIKEQVDIFYAQDQHQQIIDLLQSHTELLDFALNLQLIRAYINAANADRSIADDYYAYANALLDKFTLEGKEDATWLFYKGYALYKLGLINDATIRFERALRFVKIGKDDQLLPTIRKMLSLCQSFDPDNQELKLSKEDSEKLSEHIKQHFGSYQILFKTDRYELLDIQPTEEHPFHMIVTLGLSGRKLNVPQGVDPLTNSRIELCLCLPAEWEFTNSEEYNIWPINSLCDLINFILSTDEFIGFGYTYSNGKPLHSSTAFVGGMLTALGNFNTACQNVTLQDGAMVRFFELIYLYPMEVAYRQSHNAIELLELFSRNKVLPSPLKNREDVCAKLFIKQEDPEKL